jgi:tyrosine-protein kinase Etk/Wzc
MQEKNPLDYIYIDEESINFREELDKYIVHWKWFVLGIAIALLTAFIYLRYTPHQYQVSTTILIDDENSGGLPSELSAFEDLGLMDSGKKLIENEIGLLKSRSLMENVVKELGVNTTYYTKGRVNEIEIYKNSVPFKINFFSKDSIFYNLDTVFTIQVISATNFILKNSEDTNSAEYFFGKNITTDFGDITVTPTNINPINVRNAREEIKVKISPLKTVVERLRDNIEIELLFKKSSLIKLSLKAPIKLKAEDILNDLVIQYNKDAVEDKSLIGNNTNTFINERLKVIEKDLRNVDKGVEEFKTTNKLTDISSEASLVLESNTQLGNKIVDLNTQLKLADYIEDYVTNNTGQLIPANLGLTDDAVSSNSARYNELLLERNRILNSSGKKNPIIVNLEAQLLQLKASIAQSLVNIKSSLQIALNDATNQENKLYSRIYSVPKQEREYRDIQRQQQIIETLYLYLLQKREENAISLAVTVPNAKIIDTADGSNIPVSPRKIIIYLIAVLLGLIITFMVFYILFLFDNKVHTSKDVEAEVKAPFLGDIPKTKTDKKVIVSGTDSGSVSEAFRMLRTNVNFMLTNIKEASKTIYVTSTIPNEGKTFIAINLATVLTLSNKKVLLIGSDMRKPKIAEYLGVKLTDTGLSRFLIDSNLNVQDIIEHIQETNFDIIQSGIVPPNPSELLMNGRFEDLLAYGKEHYDYIIVDTSPVNMVTDTLLLSQNADLCLFVIRANYLDKRMLEIPKKLHEEKRLPNMAVVLNNSDLTKGYGYGYGYGNSEESSKKGWLKKLRI